MSPEVEKLSSGVPVLCCLSLLAIPFLRALHQNRVPFLRFQPPRRREPPLWRLTDFVVLLLVFFLSQLAVGVLVFFAAGSAGDVVFPVTAISSVVVCVLIRQLVRGTLGQSYATLGLAPVTFRELLTGLVFFLTALLPIFLSGALWQLFLGSAFGREPKPQELVESFRDLAGAGATRPVVLFVLAGSLLAPVTEELLFRGILFGALRVRVGPISAGLISSFVFTLVHRDLGTFVSLWLLGCALAYVYCRTGSLYVSMACHALLNSITFFVVLLLRGWV